MSSKYQLFNDLEDKKKRISQAAVTLFSKKSFSKTTVKKIASEAGVGKGTFYNYFDSKESLLIFLLDYGTINLIEVVKENIKECVNPEKKLKKAIDAQLKFYNDNHDYFIFYLREMWSYREGLEEQIMKLKEEYITIFESIIKEGSKKEVFKKIDVETIASGLFGFMCVASSHWALFSKEFPLENIDNSIEEVILNGILRG